MTTAPAAPAATLPAPLSDLDVFAATPLAAHLRQLATESGISDLYVEPGQKVRLKRRGAFEVSPGAPATAEDWQALVAAVAEATGQVFDASSRFSVDCALGWDGVRFRGSLLNHHGGQRIVLRYLPSQIRTLEELGAPAILRNHAVQLTKGLILVCGPTGSGKTSTIAAFLQHYCATHARHLYTLEDPIEYLYTGGRGLVTQREIGRHEKTFGAGLKTALRAAPDVILIGEIRDLEVADIAIQAAISGHLVIATMHTGTVEETVQRFLGLFPPERTNYIRDVLAQALEVVIIQNLLRVDQGARRLALHEVYKRTTAGAANIRGANWNGLRMTISTGSSEGHQSFEFALRRAAEAGRISAEDVREYAPLYAPGKG